MINKLLKSLLSRKFFLVLVSICYMLSFIALCYFFSYQKQQISDASVYRAIAQVNNEAISLAQAKDIASSLKKEKCDGYFIFMLGEIDAVIYDNDLSFLQSTDFTNEKQILVNSMEVGEIGETISIDGDEYEIIGYSKTDVYTLNNIFNISKISDDAPIIGMIYYEKTLPTKTLTSKFEKSFASFGDDVIIMTTDAVSVVDIIVKNQLFLIVISLLAMSVMIGFIINIYFFQIRSKFVSVCLSFGVRKNKLLTALVLEQIIIMFPMLVISSGIFALLHLIAGEVFAPMGVVEFMVLGAIYFIAMLIVIALNFTLKLRRNYV